MKKNLLNLVVLFVFCSNINAQKGASSSTFEKGNILINAGIGLGGLFFGAGYGVPIGLGATGEYGITDNISIGGGASLSTVAYKFAGTSIKYNAIGINARGSYHFDFINVANLDPYAGLAIGFVNVAAKENNSITNGIKSSGIGWGAYVGARYYFTPNIGVYGELGATSLSILNVGAAFKF